MRRTPLVLVAMLAACTSRAGTLFDASLPDAGARALADGGPPDARIDRDAGGAIVLVQPGAPPDAPERFGSSERSPRAPSISYPLDGTLLPPNLGGLEIHFDDAYDVLFEIAFAQGGVRRVVVYDGCHSLGSGCRLALDDATWSVLAEGRAAGPYTVRVRSVGPVADGPVGESEPIEIELADEPVTGGLYFWSTSPPAIHRYDFDRARRVSEVFYTPEDSGGDCVGCHALSRDGRTIAVGQSADGPFAIVDVASRVGARALAGAMAAFSPDGTEIVIGGMPFRGPPGPLEVARTDGTGARVSLGAGLAPDWSPDGRTIVATVADGSLARWDRDDAGAWIAGGAITPATGGLDAWDLYGAFAPDSEWIAFSRLRAGAAPGSGEGRIWALGRDGRGARVLERASRGTHDTWARWSPRAFVHRGEPLYWLTFTSDLRYGLDEPVELRRAIWMAAFLPASGELDPSRAPFRLPDQPETGSNFIPQWAPAIERQPCDATDDCRAGEICESGACVPDVI